MRLRFASWFKKPGVIISFRLFEELKEGLDEGIAALRLRAESEKLEDQHDFRISERLAGLRRRLNECDPR